MNNRLIEVATGILLLSPLGTGADPVAELQTTYTQQGATRFTATAGEGLWLQKFTDGKTKQQRSCVLCHTDDLSKPGKHFRTGKPIEPMAVSVNPQRLRDRGKIEKWFKRNCKWTLGRECTAQEKGDLLAFIRKQ